MKDLLYYEKLINEDATEWVLFIHGLGGSTKTWKYQMDRFSKEYNLLLVDLDGHGNSSQEEAVSPYKPTSTARLIDKILVHENIEKVHIVSLSLGTLIALEYVRLYPEKVSSIVLAGGIVNLDRFRKIVFRIARFTTAHFPVEQAYTLFAHIIMPFHKHKQSRDIFIREAKKLNQATFRKWVESVGKSNDMLQNYVSIIKNYKIPTLFISGKRDYLFLDGIKELCKKTKEFQFHALKDCGHVCSIEKSNLFNNLTLDFLESIHPTKHKYAKMHIH